jgi:hypothetical protein
MASRKRTRQRTTADAYRELSPESRYYIHLYTAPRASGSRRTQAEYDAIQDAWEKFPPDERADVRELMTRVPFETLQQWYREQTTTPSSGDRRRRDPRNTKRFQFADVHTRRLFEEMFVEEVNARNWRPVLAGRTYTAHGRKYQGPLLAVLAFPERGVRTTYYVDALGNVYTHRGRQRFQRIGNVRTGPG